MMKSYTDIEQSKKLAEILPIESNGEIQQWEDLDKYQQIQVINSLGQFYALFFKHYKGNEK